MSLCVFLCMCTYLYVYVCVCVCVSVCVSQTAFEILSFVSVMSNCWLLLLSPRIREFCLEGGISGRNIMLVAILVEVCSIQLSHPETRARLLMS